MADTLKFGPEWLRQLSSGGSVTSPPPSPSFGGKYKLAEYRYGREEMLSLFMPKFKAPDDLQQYKAIFVERCQEPMAVIPPSEEEQRLLASSVNSNAVLRQVMGGRGNAGAERGGPPGVRTASGRGAGPMDRTRGRGRGRGNEAGFFQRGFDDDLGAGRGEPYRAGRSWDDRPTKVIERDSTGFLSARSFDETTDKRRGDPYSRSMPGDAWGEMRKGGEDGANTNTGQSPSDTNNDSDWRKAGKDRQPRGSWREARSIDDEQRYQPPGERGFQRQTSFDRRQNNRYNRSDSYTNHEDELPEWAQEGAEEEGGTFDSSGAFMSLKDVEEPDIPATTNGTSEQKLGRQNSSAIRTTNKNSQPVESQSKGASPTDADKPPKNVSADQNTSNDESIPSPTVNDSEQLPNITDKPEKTSAESSTKPPTTGHDDGEADFDHLAKAAEQMMATWAAEEEPAPTETELEINLTPAPEHADKWFYKDPQDRLQGPFGAQEMAEWFSAGYFTMTLLVKRGRDMTFQPLGEIIKRHGGRQPFLPSQDIPGPGSVPVSAGVDAAAINQERQMLYMMQQQQLMQQQTLIRQQQLQQIIQTLQSNEEYSKLSPQQINQLAMQILVSKEQQKQALLAQQQQQAMLGTTRNASPPQQQQQQQPEDDMIWGAANRSWKQQLMEHQAVEEIAQKEAARRQQQEMEELERQQREYQMIQQRIEEERQKKEELTRQLEEQQRQEQLARQRQQEEIERQQRLQHERELQQQKEKAQLAQQMLYEQQKQAELDAALKRTLELQRQKDLEIQRAEEKRRKEEEAQAEMQRRADLQRQQAEQERLQAMQLPQTAQWAKGGSASGSSSVPTLQQIQQTQREREEKERVENEVLLKQVVEQRQRSQAEQQAQLKWAAQASAANPTSGKKSLREIQEEEARQLEAERQKQKATAAASLPLAAAGTWGSKATSGWANEGAWGDSSKKAAVLQSSKPKQASETFPSLSAGPAAPAKQKNTAAAPSKKKQNVKKDEEKVQKMFQPAVKSTDDKFMDWCTKSLNGLNASIDVHTFVTFLRQIESPYEVQDYVRGYLGESSRSNQFAKEFLEKRSNANKQNKASNDDESLWGPAPAVNPALQRQVSSDQSAGSGSDKKKKSKKTGKMQKLEASSLLGFTVGASSNRLNIGEIERE